MPGLVTDEYMKRLMELQKSLNVRPDGTCNTYEALLPFLQALLVDEAI